MEVLEYEVLAVRFRVLRDPTRLRVFQILRDCARSGETGSRGPTRPAGSLSVSEVAQRLGLPLSSVSQHLKQLKTAGLILTARRGHCIFSWVNPLAVTLVQDYWGAETGQGSSALETTPPG